MNTTKTMLITVAFIAIGLLAFALYLQHIEGMQPCPLCVIQRYAFAAIALFCLIAAALPPAGERAGAALGALTAIAGAGVAGWHIHVKSSPDVSCGIDPLETTLNTIPTAELMPFLFKADGLCSTNYAPILGLSLPQWALLWFAVLSVAMMRVALKRR
ncbi:disulfide bond formation protein B [Oxalicibacterium faecigallinarum]|uniref:Disulfide bond formation protein B n=1 Tax=Oxalicibacterium faecigallinarum TaxID=573741 RepID=A0A8J3F2S6_9BURK|nr:disulfide bond formation protein B [Oxalicibacterium faecigallinarum]GGI18816.1 disulfide bond formation protein B [Oxalicibacterium faecigallinarum]